MGRKLDDIENKLESSTNTSSWWPGYLRIICHIRIDILHYN